jgi:hypothetical protein
MGIPTPTVTLTLRPLGRSIMAGRVGDARMLVPVPRGVRFRSRT